MKFVYTLILVVVFQAGFAKTYYINPNGNDISGNGSIPSPWKTLFKATSNVFLAGDVIHVMAGVYVETIQCDLAVGVSIEGDGQNTTIIKSTSTADWKALLVASSGTEGTPGNQHISDLKFDGQSLATAWGIMISGRSNVSIYNCTFVDFRNRGVAFTGRIDNNNTAPGIYAKGNSFHDNTMKNCAEYVYGNYGTGCLNIGGQEGMLIYNNTISQNSRAEGHNGWPIKYTNDGFLKGCKIYNNKLSKIPMGNDPGINGWDFAIELVNVSGLEIYGNNIQGSIDLNRVTKETYDYGVWIHHNRIGQPVPNKYLETGITLEFDIESATIENNQLFNLGIPVFFTPREGNLISDVNISNNTCDNIGIADGRHQGLAIRIGEDGGRTYFLENFKVYNNKFTGNANEKPHWGIAITGISKANNIQIRQNTIKNFSAGAITANPASAIDSIFITGNILSNNGFANRAAFYGGSPMYFNFEGNQASGGSVFSIINLKMNLVRPLYYELKSSDMMVLFTIFTFLIGIWFMIKEHIYAFLIFIIYTGIHIIISFEKEFRGDAVIYLLFTIVAIYGWVNWSKRTIRHHRVVRISTLTKKETLEQFALFGAVFFLCIIAMHYYQSEFSPGAIPLADAFIIAAALTGFWLMTRKKTESWYWWVATSIISIPLYFLKHRLIISILYSLLFILAVWGYGKWKKMGLKIKDRSTQHRPKHP